MASDRVVDRYVKKVQRFRGGIGDRSFISVSDEDGAGWDNTAADGINMANVRRAVDSLGADEVRRRTTTPARAADAVAKAASKRRIEIVGSLRVKAAQAPGALLALSLRFSLPGCCYNCCRADLPFTVADAAAVLRQVVKLVADVPGWQAVSVVDATDQGHPHVHVVAVLPIAQRRHLYTQIIDAYARYGVDARGSVCLDRN